MGRGLLVQRVELAWHDCISPLAPHGGPCALPTLLLPARSAVPGPLPGPNPPHFPCPTLHFLTGSRFSEKESCT